MLIAVDARRKHGRTYLEKAHKNKVWKKKALLLDKDETKKKGQPTTSKERRCSREVPIETADKARPN